MRRNSGLEMCNLRRVEDT